jgi:release factor glutamine methyltransferase
LKYNPSLKIEECLGVYSPSDDTFLLIDSLDVREGEDILEMGCGSGIISLHCVSAGANVTAADINPAAVRCTLVNARRNGMKVKGIVSDLFSDISGAFDQIVFNPPYLPEEDRNQLAQSWSGGEGGVEVIERFLRDARRFLRPGGRITIVVSSRMDTDKFGALTPPFEIERIATKRLFFEVLSVLSLKSR